MNIKKLLSAFIVVNFGLWLFYVSITSRGGIIDIWTQISLFTYAIVLPIILYYLNNQRYKVEKFENVISAVLSVLISQFITMGSCTDIFDFPSIIFTNFSSIAIWCVQSVVYGFIGFYFIRFLIFQLQNYCLIQGKKINLKTFFWGGFLVNLAFFCLIYPCVFDYDAFFGLRTYLDPAEIKSNHMPYFIQIVHGYFWYLGKMLGNPTWGLLILTMLFCLFASLTLTYGISIFRHLGITQKNCLFILLLSPIYILISHYPTKDGFFAYFFLLYTLSILALTTIKKRTQYPIFTIVVHVLGIIGVCLSRNQGIYITLIESIFLLFYLRKQIILFLSAVVVVFLVYFSFIKVYLPYKKVVSSPKSEMLGSLFQQTALYSLRYRHGMTDDEVNNISAILPLELISQKYNPKITDPVKDCYATAYFKAQDGVMHFKNTKIENENIKLKKYLKSWLVMLLKHPVCYFDASFAVNYAFFYNRNLPIFGIQTVNSYIKLKATTHQYAFAQNYWGQKVINWTCLIAARCPILSWYASIPYYIWLFIILSSMVIYRKDWTGLAFFMPSILSFGILLVCPVANARYMYPILLCIPFFVLYLLITNKRNKRL